MSDKGSASAALSSGQWLIVTLLFAMSLLNYLDRQILSVLAPVLRQEIGLNEIGYAWVLNAFLIAYAVMYTISGLIVDRTGSRIGLALFVGGWSLVSLLHGGVRSIAELALLRFLLGVFEPGGWTGAVKAVSERFSAAQRGIATGFFGSGSSLAMSVAPPLIVFLSLHYGWRLAFAFPSALGFLWIPLWLIATKRTASTSDANAPRVRLSWLGVTGLIRDKRVLAYVAARFFGDSSGYFFLFWLPQYLATEKHFSFTMLGTLGWIPYVCSDIGPIIGGYGSTRLILAGHMPIFSRKVMMTAGAVLLATGAAFHAYSETWVVLLSLSISALGMGFWGGNLHVLPADAFPSHVVSTSYGLAGSVGAIGGIVFNVLVGHLSRGHNYFAVFAILSLLQPLGVAALWIWLRDRARECPTPAYLG